MPITHRQRAILLALATATALLVAAAGLAGVTGPATGDASTADAKGPTAAAQRRDLETSITLTGTIDRADTTTIIYGGNATPRGAAGGTIQPTSATGTVTEDATETQTATITALAAIGVTTERGTLLYRADDEPVVVFLADEPLFRDLSVGVDDGTDVQAVEQNLVDLGLTDLNPDQHFGSDTAAAVESWEESVGRSDPDGEVSVGEVVLLNEPAAVLTHDAQVGDLIEPGDTVLTLGAESQVVETDVDATTAHDWSTGSTVNLVWGDGSSSIGTVGDVGRDVTDGDVQVVIALDQQSTKWPIGTDVQVLRTTAVREGATAVPVSAVAQGARGAAVRVVEATTDRVVNVKLGIVADGWVEITDGIEPGTKVRLPG